jgi:hypothetical protein
MSEENEPKRRLSEISHLFLSSVRDRQTGGAERPKRTPPPPQPKGNVSIDLTPEELAQVVGESRGAAENMPRATPPVTAVLGTHLNGRQFDRVKEYARHLSARIGRIGLIEIDAAETRLMYFVPSTGDEPQRAQPIAKSAEPRELAEAMEELNCDVDRWLLLVSDARSLDGRALLRETDHWAVLSTADHDGVVSTYRLLKGLCEVSPKPRLTMALLDRPEEAQIGKVFRKLAGVCQQFLQWTLEIEEPIAQAPGVGEYPILSCRPARDAQQSNVATWQIVRDFLESIRPPASTESTAIESDDSEAMEEMIAEFTMPELPEATAAPSPESPTPAAPATRPASHFGEPSRAETPAPIAATAPLAESAISDVIDLAGAPTAEAILSAIIANSEHALVACPIRPPMCPQARLAVNRDRTLVLLGVAHTGLKELTAIGQALHWLTENRALIAMAMPQLAIDAQRLPMLRLLVDKSDAAAAPLRPLLESTNVTLSAYRTIRWSGRMGLLLEAA